MSDRKTPGHESQTQPKETGLRGVVSAATEAGQGLAAAAGEYAGQARDKVEEWTAAAAAGAGNAKDQVQQWVAAATDQTGDALKTGVDELAHLIRRYPVPALLVGFGLGFLAGRTRRGS